MAQILGQNGNTTYWDEDPESVQGDIFRGLNKQIGAVGEENLRQKKRKETVDDAVALIKAKMPLERESAKQTARDKVTEAIRLLKAKQRYTPDRPTTSISITEQPFSERIKAREILSRTPRDYEQAGMATAKRSGGILGWGWGPGSKRNITLSPEAAAEQEEARQVLGRKNKVTKRITSKGGYGQDIIDATAENIDTEEKTAEERFNELIAQGMTEDDAYDQLTQEGY